VVVLVTLTDCTVATALARHSIVVVDPLVLTQVNTSPVEARELGNTYVCVLTPIALLVTVRLATVDADEFNGAVPFSNPASIAFTSSCMSLTWAGSIELPAFFVVNVLTLVG